MTSTRCSSSRSDLSHPWLPLMYVGISHPACSAVRSNTSCREYWIRRLRNRLRMAVHWPSMHLRSLLSVLSSCGYAQVGQTKWFPASPPLQSGCLVACPRARRSRAIWQRLGRRSKARNLVSSRSFAHLQCVHSRLQPRMVASLSSSGRAVVCWMCLERAWMRGSLTERHRDRWAVKTGPMESCVAASKRPFRSASRP